MTGQSLKSRFEVGPGGWLHWPEREDLSLELVKLMAAAQEGASTVSECLLVASRIDCSDDNSWHAEWTRIGDANDVRAFDALAKGNVLTARSNWLRAMNYHRAAACPLDLSDEKRCAATVSMRRSAASFVKYREPVGEMISIPWLEDFALQGYFLPARANWKVAPTIVCIGEPGDYKEELLFKTARYAFERGISVLAVDLLGDGSQGVQFDELVRRNKMEAAVGRILDYVYGRQDVDRDRIAVFADGWGSSFVSRGIAFDERVAAVACDGGVWDLKEREFLRRRATLLGVPTDPYADINWILRRIDCPVLITLGELGWLEADWVRGLANKLTADHPDITLKVFKASETGAAQGHVDNPTLANEYIFDWIASRLNINAVAGPVSDDGVEAQQHWSSDR